VAGAQAQQMLRNLTESMVEVELANVMGKVEEPRFPFISFWMLLFQVWKSII